MDSERDGILPNELWLTSFQSMDRRTLKSIRLVSRSFAQLSWEVVLRDVTWSNPNKAANSQCWKENPVLAILPRDLSVRLAHWTLTDRRIFERICSFTKLEVLTFVDAVLTTELNEVISQLRSLKRLTLHHCALSADLMEPPVPLPRLQDASNITDLQINLVRDPSSLAKPWSTDTMPCAGLFHLLPRLRTLHIDGCVLPTEVLGSGITALTISIPHIPESDADGVAFARDYFCRVLWAMPQLRRLTAYEYPSNEGDGDHPNDPPQPVPAPDEPPRLCHLTHFSGAMHFAQLALSASLELENVCQEGDGEDVVKFIEFLQERQTPVRRLSIKLPEGWDAEVVRAATYCLPRCEVLEIEYEGCKASEDALLELGIEHIPRLTHLREISILNGPTTGLTEVQEYSMQDIADEMGAQLSIRGYSKDLTGNAHEDLVDEEGDDSDPAGVLLSWTRYNPTLQRACISGSGISKWVREYHASTKEWITVDV
ncbi:hypothetical protein FB451DRAFT_1241835 [Mycena latifolia]|nr:hypothetical protein FB451DRAFT_1241835 [Mycena latifolia]